MINKIKTIAALLVAGATATQATTVTNTYTNVLQSLNYKLTLYSQGPTNSAGTSLKDIVTTIATKDIINGLSAATGTNFGKTASLVQSTIFTNNVIVTAEVKTNDAATNTTAYTNTLTFGTNLVSLGAGGFVTISNLVIINSDADFDSTNVTATYTYLNTNGVTVTNTLDTNAGVSVTLSTVFTNGVTNLITSASTNLVVVTNMLLTGNTKIEVMSGTAAAPVFTDVSSFFRDYTSENLYDSVGSNNIVTQTGKSLTTSNAVITTAGFLRIDHFYLGYFVTNNSTASNIYIVTQGFTKGALKLDALTSGKTKLSEALQAGSFTSTVNGWGYIGGTTVVTNSWDANGSTSVDLPWLAQGHEFTGTNFAVIQGYVTNPIPVVIEGTISSTFLKNLAAH